MQERANKGRNVLSDVTAGGEDESRLNGRRFEVIAVIQSETEAVLDNVAKWEFQRERHWSRCAKSEGITLN